MIAAAAALLQLMLTMKAFHLDLFIAQSVDTEIRGDDPRTAIFMVSKSSWTYQCTKIQEHITRSKAMGLFSTTTHSSAYLV